MNLKEEIINCIKEATPISNIKLEVPKDFSHGDYAFPCFTLSKEMKKSPVDIAKDLVSAITLPSSIEKAEAVGPYLNFFVKTEVVMKNIANLKFNFKEKGKMLVESPGPNTNKPLHLGHVRNGLIGNAIINLLKRIGKEVHHVDVINDRGIHICKSMLAYKKFGEGDSPEKSKLKPDHFVGKYYVLFAEKVKENPSLEEEAKEMLIAWEKGNEEVLALWKKMNKWALEGMFETYKKLDLDVEKPYYESETYKEGKEIVLDGLKKGIFSKREDGAIIVDLKDIKLDEKVLLRPDGTSVYITQDIAMAKKRYDDYKMDGMVYVVGNEQNYHFKVLFEILKRLQYKFADNCYHMSYGMVELPEGKMKSREGKVVDADDLIAGMVDFAREEVKKRYKDISDEEADKRAKIIGMGSLKFFFLKFDATKDFVFDPKESISFEGETGPYVQYVHARICSILEKAEDFSDGDLTILNENMERNIAVMLSRFEDIVVDAALNYKPHLIARYLLDLSQMFNEYYHKVPILKADEKFMKARLVLISKVKKIISDGLALLGIEAPEKM